MTKKSSIPCSHPGCRRNTSHATGRCHDHRNYAAVTNPVAALVSPSALSDSTTWTSEDLPGGVTRRTKTVFGHTTTVEHFLDGDTDRPHRLDGPARTSYDDQGRVKEETYARYGTVSRVDGPAIIEYDPNTGKPIIEIYAFRRENHQDPAYFAAILRTYSNEVLEEEFLASSYRPLLESGHSVREIIDVFGQGVKTAEGIREVLGGSPIEWVRSYESAASR